MKVLVIGAGLSGTAVSKLLVNKGYEVILTDAKSIENKDELEKLGISVYDNGHPDFLKNHHYDFIVKNPGIPYHVPFVKYFNDLNMPILNEIEVASNFVNNYKYGAITGTNGKTTTTSILGALLKTKNEHNGVCGNIGKPLSDIVLEYGDENIDLAVEVAAFQLLGFDKFHPSVSVCTNLTPDHIDYFKNLENYYKAKMLVYKNQLEDDYFLLNIDDEEVLKYAVNIPCKVIRYSIYKDADLCIKDDSVYLFDERLFDLQDLHLPGKHNVQNAMVAACMAYYMGVSISNIQKVIKEFKGVEHRIEYVTEINGVKYYNDSKGTNTDATIVALKAFDKPVILLAGGYDKKTGFEELRPYLSNIKQMIVFGETKAQLKELDNRAIVVNDMYEAIDEANKLAVSGDIVLLSPVCASWDQFRNFEERGELFKKYVLKDLEK